MKILNEDRRNQLMAQGKRGEAEKDGYNRYQKRLRSKIANTVKNFNEIDMQSLFVHNILTVNIPVKGETDNYLVRIKFGGFLDFLRTQLERQNNILNLRAITVALTQAFNQADVLIGCSCSDFFYRFGYWSTMKGINSGPPERRPSKITNPKNNKGPGCKHVMLVLSNNSWIIKVSSVINNYIKYMEKYRKKDYADIIYPAIYGHKYEEPVQLSIDDSGQLDSSKEVIDTANAQGRVSGRFQAGNPYRYRPQNRPNRNQVTIDDIEEN